MSEWIVELTNSIMLVIGYLIVFYFGSIFGERKIDESDKRYEVLYKKVSLERDEYRERYNNIHYVLENITEEDVKLLSNDNWNSIILKKNKETEEDEPIEWIRNGRGDFIPVYSRK